MLATPMSDAPPTAAATAAAEWDAGAMGCGDLVMELFIRLKQMPGQVLRVVATDPGAPEDIPAWCRMTRNELLHYHPPSRSYWIRSRAEW